MPFLYLLSRIVTLPRALSCQYEKNVFPERIEDLKSNGPGEKAVTWLRSHTTT